jgi:multimeric flavodoxin WrbA
MIKISQEEIMPNVKSRRKFLKTVSAAVVTGVAATSVSAQNAKTKIIGVACSPRQGKTTATAVQIALEAAAAVDSAISTEMIDLGAKTIYGWAPPDKMIADDFESILPAFKSADLGGIIIGTPVYFRNMSSLCAAFLERLAVLRKPKLLLADRAVGVLAVGAYRNGGQEMAIQQIQTAMLCHEVLIVGGKPGAHQGATLWNAFEDDITKDEFGVDSAKKLGIRLAEAVLS